MERPSVNDVGFRLKKLKEQTKPKESRETGMTNTDSSRKGEEILITNIGKNESIETMDTKKIRNIILCL